MTDKIPAGELALGDALSVTIDGVDWVEDKQHNVAVFSEDPLRVGPFYRSNGTREYLDYDFVSESNRVSVVTGEEVSGA